MLSLASLGQTTSAFQGDLQINPGTSNLTDTGQGKFEIDGGTSKVHLERLDAGDDIGDSYETIKDSAKADKSETTESGTLSLLQFFLFLYNLYFDKELPRWTTTTRQSSR